MTERDEQLERLDALISKGLDGKMSDAECGELNERLGSSIEARRQYHRHIDLHIGLEWMLNPKLLETTTELETLILDRNSDSKSRRSLPYLSWSGWLAAAAAVVIFTILFQARQPTKPEGPSLAEALEPSLVARANYSADAELAASSTVTRQGEWFSSGRIVLVSGTLGLTFDSGARVVLQGPAEFNLESSNRGFLHRGQAVAQVPEAAIGFIIQTPNSTLVDLGTEFSVRVDGERSSVKVIDGEVKAFTESPDGRTEELLLQKNEAVHIDHRAETAIIPANDFPSESFHNWAHFQQPEADYIHFDFESESATATGSWGAGGRLFTERAAGRGDAQPPQPRVGVFGQAMRFCGKGAFFTSNLEGIAGSSPRTVACWIKLPPEAHDSAIAIVAWGNPTKGGLWQLGVNHSTQFGTLGALRMDFSNGHVTGSTDLRDGRWHHVASVYVGGHSEEITSHVRLYVDGKLEAVSQVFQPVHINTKAESHKKADNLTIGYRIVGGPRGVPIKTFKGSIDELYVFDAAILPSQIKSLIHFNQPNYDQK